MGIFRGSINFIFTILIWAKKYLLIPGFFALKKRLLLTVQPPLKVFEFLLVAFLCCLLRF